jgi:hypothetical protein
MLKACITSNPLLLLGEILTGELETLCGDVIA